MGAYEFQTRITNTFIGWLQQFGLPTDGSATFADSDGDGLNCAQEWFAGTDPTNAASVLRVLSATNNGAGVDVTWTSVTNRTYSIERVANLAGAPAFSLVQSNLPGLASSTTFTDGNAGGSDATFYRVRVEP